MHILWFTGVELPAVTGSGLARAGWQEGLRQALEQGQPQLKLSIASFGSKAYQPFTSGNATYYNIYREPEPGSRWKRLLNNWLHRTYQDSELERCLEIVDLVQPDLIFVFGTENPFGLIADQVKVPVLISIQAVLHGLVGHLFDGLTLQELVQEFFSREILLGTGLFHRWWTLRRYLPIERRIYELNSYFSGRTAWDRNWCTKLNSRAAYFHIDRVLGAGYYQAVWEPPKGRERTIFSLSSNAPFKGGLTLVRSLVRLKEQGIEDIELRLGGISLESSLGKYISRILSRSGLRDQVVMLGRIDTAQIVQEMLTASLFVLPSHLDNSPNSLAQAMLVGMPCIASNAGGIPSMLEDGREGLIYDHREIDQLAGAIRKLLEDPELARSCGENARAKALVRHDRQRIAAESLRCYQAVLDGWRTKLEGERP